MARYRSRLLASASSSLGALAVAVLPLTAYANPLGGQVTAGSATIATPSPTTLQVNQTSQKAVIDWRSFNIGQGETTQFVQPNAAAITLNRVNGGDPSQILGSLRANGQVWLVNPNGIVFGNTARVDVAGLLATTLNITNADFMAGNYTFASTGQPDALVVNAGRITVRQAGLAALVAPGVANSGVITARLGTIQLASASGFALDLYGDRKFNFLLTSQVADALTGPDGQPLKAAVSNSGALIADGGQVLLSASLAKSVVDQAINMDGYIQARSVGSQAGTIVLDAGTNGAVQVSGQADVSGKAPGTVGGSIQVMGQAVSLAPTTILNASGDGGGGSVRVGGDFHGQGDILTADTTNVAAGALINVSAQSSGDAGTAVVWSNHLTNFAGTILGQGGALSGNGGSVEVSSHQQLDFTGTVDLRAPAGAIGNLLLDPENVTISATGGLTPTLPYSPTGPLVLTPTADSSILAVSTLQSALALASVTVSTGSTGSQAGDITVASNVSWSSGNSLTLSAYRNVVVDTGVTIANTGAGSLLLRPDSAGIGTGVVTFNGTGQVDFSGSTGTISIFYNPADNPAGSVVNATSYTAPTNYGPSILTNGAVSGQLTAYMLVNTVYDLQNVQNNLSGSYALGGNINASATSTWNSGAGFTPIGGASSFTGIFDGQGETISGLTINSTAAQAGLFSNIQFNAIVRNLSLTGLSVTDNAASADVGAVAGYVQNGNTTNWTFLNVSAAGSVTGTGTGENVGGLVGLVQESTGGDLVASGSSFAGTVQGNGTTGGAFGVIYSGEIANSSTSGTVSGSGDLGGLVGYMQSVSITNSFSSATVNLTNSTGNNQAGGLVGEGAGSSITGSYATGNVTDTVGGTLASEDEAGGLVAVLGGSINTSYATGTVSAGNNTTAGGLVGGLGNANSSVTLSYALGPTTAGSGSNVGGLVGSAGWGLVSKSFSTGSATGGANSNVGGLVGYIATYTGGPVYYGTVANSYSTGAAQGGAISNVGGLVGEGSGGIVQTSYSTGAVTGGGGSSLGGLLGSGSTQVTNGYWDTTTSGQTTQTGEGTGVSDATLKAGIPSGFDPTIWASASGVNGGLPYLSANPPTSPPVSPPVSPPSTVVVDFPTPVSPPPVSPPPPPPVSPPPVSPPPVSPPPASPPPISPPPVSPPPMSPPPVSPPPVSPPPVSPPPASPPPISPPAPASPPPNSSSGALNTDTNELLNLPSLQAAAKLAETSQPASSLYSPGALASVAISEIRAAAPGILKYISAETMETILEDAFALFANNPHFTVQDLSDFLVGYFQSSGYRNLVNASASGQVTSDLALSVVTDLGGQLSYYVALKNGATPTVANFDMYLSESLATGIISGPGAQSIAAAAQIIGSGSALTISDVQNFNAQMTFAMDSAQAAQALGQRLLQQGKNAEAAQVLQIAANEERDIALLYKQHPIIATLIQIPDTIAGFISGL